MPKDMLEQIIPTTATANELFETATKLHELLGLAIADFELILVDPKYDVDFGYWHDSIENDGDRCNVCLAGSIMVRTYKAPPNQEPDHLGVNTGRRLHTVDMLRQGRIRDALQEFAAAPVRLTWSQHFLDKKWRKRLRYCRNEEMRSNMAHELLRDLRELRADLAEANL